MVDVLNIMVFDVPADSGGALAILNEFYVASEKDYNNNYIFVIGLPELDTKPNIKVLRFPWIKKSWFHRIYFDNFVAPRLIREYGTDQVLSLQNVTIPNTKVYQTVYVHNSLPFSKYRFSFFENKLLWIYQNVLSRKIFKSIIKADKVIVQTKWMKMACVAQLGVDGDKIDVLVPKVDLKIKNHYQITKSSLTTFFYPASGVPFKNHKLILDACKCLKNDGVSSYEVIVTLTGNENKHVSGLYKEIIEHELPIKFIGSLDRESVFRYYEKSILLFPSYIETVGLPMLEARMHMSPILASDCPFSHEMLEGYDAVDFFNPFDATELKSLMQNLIMRNSHEVND